MNQPPLNPDALEDAADVIWMRANGEHGVCRADRERGSYRIAVDAAEEAITAYLAAAQPEVNSLEELEALPYGSFIVGDSGVAVLKFDGPNYDWVTGSDARYRMEEQENDLPALVLYQPSKEQGNGH